MRALLLTLACIGLGFLMAKIQHERRVAGVEHLLGGDELPAEKSATEEGLDRAVKAAAGKPVGYIDVVNGKELNFGVMMRGSKRTHKFKFKNLGNGPAQIWYINSTCKCTIGKFKDATLQPGQETEVELEWTVESNLEDFSQSAKIGSDCPGQEEIQLVIYGKVGQSYVFEPPPHNYGDFYSNTETVIPVTVYSFEDTPMDFKAASVRDVLLSKKVTIELGEERDLQPGEIPDKADARHAVDFKIRLAPGIQAGPVTIPVTLARKASRPEEAGEMITYDLRGRCVTPVRIIAGDDYNEKRNFYDMGSAKSSQGLKKTFMVAIRKEDFDKDPNIRITKTVPEQLKATVSEPKISETQRIYTVTMEIPPGTEPIELDGTFSKDFGKIVIESDIEVFPVIPMYVKFRITE